MYNSILLRYSFGFLATGIKIEKAGIDEKESKHMGVHWDKRAHINQGNGGAWRATIRFKEEGKRKSRHLGYFIEKDDAIAAYNWVKEHGLIQVRINGGRTSIHYQLRDDSYYTWRDQFGRSLHDKHIHYPRPSDPALSDEITYQYLWRPPNL